MSDVYEKGREEALHYIRMGRLEQARARLDALLSEHPDDGELLYLLAVCLFDLAQYKEALTACMDAVNYGCSEVQGNILLGHIHLKLGRLSEAEGHYLEALRLDSNNAIAMAAYGLLMQMTGYEDKAQKLLDEALNLAPDSPTVLDYHLRYYIIKEKKGAQTQILQEYLRTADNEIAKLGKVGLIAYLKKDYKTARDCFREVFLSDPSDSGILELLEESEMKSHKLYMFERFRAESPPRWGFLAMIFIGIAFAFIATGHAAVGFLLILLYVLFGAYLSLVPFLYRVFVKRAQNQR